MIMPSFVKVYISLVLTIISFTFSSAQTFVVSTVIGTGNNGYVNGANNIATFNNPNGMVFDAQGNLYIADEKNHVIRKLNTAGIVSTFAGSGSAGYQEGTGINATFNEPTALAIDGLGNLYVSDKNNNRIRKITTSGVVSTFAGTGTAGERNGPANAASFRKPMGLAFDKLGYMYVADNMNHKIRRISPTGVVSDFAGSGEGSFQDGYGISASFLNPSSVAVSESGMVYVADMGNNRIRTISQAGLVSTLAGTGRAAFADGDGVLSSFSAPSGITLDIYGNVFCADFGNNRIRKINTQRIVSTVAGNGLANFQDGNGQIALFKSPKGIISNSNGELFVSDAGNARIRKIYECSAANVPSINKPLNISICAGGSIRLTSSISHRNLWSTGDTSQSISVTNAGSYTVRSINDVCTSGSSNVVNVSIGTPVINLEAKGAAIVPRSITGFSYIGRVGGSDFYRSSGTYSGYQLAKTACSTAGGSLATVNNAELNTLLASTLTSGTVAYIGLNDITQEGTFVWQDGSIPTFTNWSVGEPSGNFNENAVGIDDQGNWSDISIYSARAAFLQTPIRKDIKLCAGTHFSLKTNTNASSFQWYKNGRLLATTSTDSLYIDSIGSYYVSANFNGLCTAISDTIRIITSNAINRPNITTSGPTTVCSGSSLTLTSSAESGNIWSTGETTRSIIVSSAGRYNVQVLTGTCTSVVSNNISISIVASPETPTITGNNSLCAGGTIVLTSSSSSGNIWSTGATTQSINVTTPDVYTVKVFSGNCTSAISPAFQVNIEEPNIIMKVNGFNTKAKSIVGYTKLGRLKGKDYFLSNIPYQGLEAAKANCYSVGGKPAKIPNQAINTLIANGLPSGSTPYIGLNDIAREANYVWDDSTVATYTRWDIGQPNNNGNEDAVSINREGYWNDVNTNSNLPVILETDAAESVTICEGALVYLTTNFTGDYSWYFNDSLIPSANTGTLIANTPGMYYAKISNGANCVAKSSNMYIIVDSVPSPTISASGPTDVCSGRSVTLTSSSPYRNIWSTGDTTRSIVVTTSNTISVQTLGELCLSNFSNIVSVNINQPPAQPIIAASRLNLITGDSCELVITNPVLNATYYWNNGRIGTRQVVRNATILTAYGVLSSCTSEVSASVTITSVVNGKSNYNQVSMMPNPASQRVLIQSPNALERFTLINNLGQIVLSMPVPVSNEIDLKALPVGIYSSIIQTDKGISNSRLVIEK